MSWLEDLKPGDRVFVSSYPRDRIEEVDRLTKTQIIIGGLRFRKLDGCLVNGDGYNRARLEEVTPEREQEVLCIKLIRAISAKSLKDFNLERLKKIWGLMQ